jgi:hypothetical protein
MRVHWEYAHQCRRCGYLLRIDDIDPQTIAIGVLTCPLCETAGPVNVQIVEAKLIPPAHAISNGNRQ